ncbi:hypothetical protein ACVMAJ_000976 [Bradyrhizobium sp. USDA 4448]
MKFVVLLLVLLPVTANATPYNKDDCHFIELFVHECAISPPNGHAYKEGCSYIHSHHEALAHGYFRRRHHSPSDKALQSSCEQVCTGKASAIDMYHRFCRGKPEFDLNRED